MWVKDRQLIFTSDVTNKFSHFCSTHELKVSMAVVVSLVKAKNKQVILYLFPFFFFFFYCIAFLFFLISSWSFFCVCMESVGFSLCLCFCCHSTGYSSLEVVFLVFSPPCPLKYFHFPPNTCPFSLLFPLLMKTPIILLQLKNILSFAGWTPWHMKKLAAVSAS